MTERKRLPPPSATYLPAASSTAAPSVALPSLPTSSGKVWGSRTSIMRADADFVRAHSNYLSARVEQTSQMRSLVDVRISLALKIAELAILPELARHEYDKGRRDRSHDVAMQQLTHQTAEVNARIDLLQAHQHLQSLGPEAPSPTPAASASAGLTPDEVDELLSNFPDLTAETRHLVALALKGRFNEKLKDNE